MATLISWILSSGNDGWFYISPWSCHLMNVFYPTGKQQDLVHCSAIQPSSFSVIMIIQTLILPTKAGCPYSNPARYVCHRKVEIYQHVINLFLPVLMTGSTKVVHVLSCLCGDACKRPLAIYHKSGAFYSVNRLLPEPCNYISAAIECILLN